MSQIKNKTAFISIVFPLIFFFCSYDINPFHHRNETDVDMEVVEFEFCTWFLDVFFIFRDSLPEHPYDYFPSPKDLFLSTNEPYTIYIDKSVAEEYWKMCLTTESEEGGIGIRIDSVSQGYVIIDVTPNSPGEIAGLHCYDTIIAVNNDSLSGVGFDELPAYLKGEIGETKTMLIHRENEVVEIKVILDKYYARSVYTDNLDSAVAYICIETFASQTCMDNGTTQEFAMALDSTEWAEYTILDIRSNLGGQLSQCINVTSEFVPGGTRLMRVKERCLDTVTYNGFTQDSVWVSVESGRAINRKFVVLMNEWSASATEVLISSIHSFRSDIVSMGTKSYGKARGQKLTSTPDSGIAKTTYAVISPIEGTSYDMIGIDPKIKVDNEDDILQTALNHIYSGPAKLASMDRNNFIRRVNFLKKTNLCRTRMPSCIVLEKNRTDYIQAN